MPTELLGLVIEAVEHDVILDHYHRGNVIKIKGDSSPYHFTGFQPKFYALGVP